MLQHPYRTLLFVVLFVCIGAAVATPAVGQTATTTEVAVGGSTVEINNSAGATSFAIEEIPTDNVNISDTGNGVYDSNAGEILVGGPANPAPETYSFTLNPDSDAYSFGDTIEFVVNGEPVSLEVIGPTVTSSTVDINGSTVAVDNSVGATTFAVENLPSDVEVSDTGDAVYDSNAGELLVGGPTNPAPETYEFTLNPDKDAYTVGDNVSFTVAGSEATLNITRTTVPSDISEEVETQQYDAVTGEETKLGAGNLAAAIQSWSGDDGSRQGYVNGVKVGAGELSEMITYWA